MGLQSKTASTSNIYSKDKNKMVFDNTKNGSIFKGFLSNLAQNFVSKQPSTNVFTECKVAPYYDNITFKDLNFEFFEKSPDKIVK